MGTIARLTKALAGTGLVALFLSGCVGQQLQVAEGVAPAADTFAKSLQANYLALSRSEYAEADYIDSDKFALRSIAAGQGTLPGPEPVENRRISPEHVGAMKAGLREFSEVRDAAIERAPKLAAIAQTSFDCWLQEQEEGYQPDDIARCLKDFEFALGAIKGVLTPPPPPPAPPKPIVKAYEKFLVLFGHDSALIEGDEIKAVNKAVLAIDGSPVRRVVISGYADRSGTEKHNLKLSQTRADAVAAMLDDNSSSELGELIEIKAYGENGVAVDTPDGKREPKNRRVKIELVR